MKKYILFVLFIAALSWAGPVSYYGELSASGNKLIGSKTGASKPVQVRGISLFWSCTEWGTPAGQFTEFWSAKGVDAIADGFKAEIVRAAMAANDESGCGDYQSNATQTLQMVKTVVNRAIEKDIYVIIDWHSHKASSQQSAAIDFFVNKMAEYHNIPNVIFEIFNEPIDQSWSTIKTYSNAVISAIHSAGANNLILVGTPKWDQDVDEGANDPVSDGNVAYVQHFYAASHSLSTNTANGWSSNKTFQQAAQNTLNKNKPVFVSEYGIVESSGNGNISESNANAWHSFMDQNYISSCIWAFNNKDETASIFKSSFTPPSSGSDAAWTNNSNLTNTGTYIKNKLAAYAETAEWRNAPDPEPDPDPDPSPIFTPTVAGNAVAVQSRNGILQFSVAGGNSFNLTRNLVQVFDLSGSLIHSQNGLNPINDLPKGLYLVKIKSPSFESIQKVNVK